MAETDNPLKQLALDAAQDFAAWMLDVDWTTVQHVQPLNVELPGRDVRSDALFRVTLTDGNATLLHIEFQGMRSDRPMSLRMLDYLSRIVQRETVGEDFPTLCSVVLYIGRGAGLHDSGSYQIVCPDAETTLTWRYRVIRLWQLSAETLLATGRPTLLSLVGLTQVTAPEQVFPQVVATLHQVANVAERKQLFNTLLKLIEDKEVLNMVEKLVATAEQDNFWMNMPFAQQFREEGRAEVRQALRDVVLETVAVRFDPPITRYQRIAARLSPVNDIDQLRALHQTALRAADLAEFERAVPPTVDIPTP